jgi:hypothetical protein
VGRNGPQDGNAGLEAEAQRHTLGGAAAWRAQQPTLHHALVGLDGAHRPLTPALHCRQVLDAHAAGAQTWDKNVGGDGCILEGYRDAHTADRRHGVGGIADEQQARPVPTPQPARLDSEEGSLTPVTQ